MTLYISAEQIKWGPFYSLLMRSQHIPYQCIYLTSHRLRESVQCAFMITCWVNGILATTINYSLVTKHILGIYLLVFLVLVNCWHNLFICHFLFICCHKCHGHFYVYMRSITFSLKQFRDHLENKVGEKMRVKRRKQSEENRSLA